MSLTRLPAPQLIDGKLVAASDGATYPILNPATGAGDRQRPGRHRRRRRRRDRRRPPRLRRDRLVDRPSSSGCAACASCTRRCSTTRDEFRALTTAEVGMPGFMTTAAGVRRAGRRARRGSPTWSSPTSCETDLGVAKPMGIPTPADGAPRAGRRGRRDHAVELPDPDQPRQGRPGARRRLHGRAQAGAGHAVGGRRARPARRRAHRHPAGRLQRRHAAVQRGRRPC